MEFQPWFKVFADLPERKAHYNDGQFRAFVELMCATSSSRTPGRFPSLAAVRRIVGDVAHFLTEQGDLEVAEDGSVTIHGWAEYQRPIDRTASERQARHRERKRDGSVSHAVDNALHNALSDRDAPSSTSTSISRESIPSAPAREGGASDGSDWDSLDVYHSLTGFRPWGVWSGDTLRAAMRDYGDERVTACLREAYRLNPSRDGLLKDALALMAKTAERARLNKPAKPSRKVVPLDPARYDAARRELLAPQESKG